ncbi:MAG: GNAT family N-acetyltransferase [Acidimicrobiia bacterium]|nr:GNAT family N-acetyltransferase [Acidimicrobiia bacterium]
MATDVKLAGPDDVPAIARALGRAFRDDPVFEFLLPDVDVDTRARRATPFFAVDARIRIRQASAWTTPAGEGAALWAAPDQWRTTVRDGLRMAWPILRGSRGRSLRALSAMQIVEKEHPKAPHWYLAVLGTDPDHQGKGIGAALMAPALERCDSQGVPAFLESSKESNIPYYERYGFRVQRPLTIGKGAPTVWQMWRDPR